MICEDKTAFVQLFESILVPQCPGSYLALSERDPWCQVWRHRPVTPAHTKKLEDIRLGYTDVTKDKALNHSIKINM